MADLFSSLTTAARSLEAQRFALDATGQNIANASTPGYTRRVVDFAAVPPYTADSAGSGVEVAGIRSQRDLLIERRLEQETTAAQREAALADSLGVVELALGSPGSSIDGELTEFCDSFARRADSPTSPVARREVAQQGESLARAIRQTAGQLEQARRDANERLGAALDEINALAERIAALNDSIGAAGADTAGLHMADEQAQLVRELSGLIDIRVLRRPQGGVDIDVADGRALVVGSNQYSLVGTASGADGMLQVSINGTNITPGRTSSRFRLRSPVRRERRARSSSIRQSPPIRAESARPVRRCRVTTRWPGPSRMRGMHVSSTAGPLPSARPGADSCTASAAT